MWCPALGCFFSLPIQRRVIFCKCRPWDFPLYMSTALWTSVLWVPFAWLCLPSEAPSTRWDTRASLSAEFSSSLHITYLPLRAWGRLRGGLKPKHAHEKPWEETKQPDSTGAVLGLLGRCAACALVHAGSPSAIPQPSLEFSEVRNV